MLAELCETVSAGLNKLAADLGLESRVCYVNVVNGHVVVLRFRRDSKPNLFGKRRTSPGYHAWGWW